MTVRRCASCLCLLDLAGEIGPLCGACIHAPEDPALFGPVIEPEVTDSHVLPYCQEDRP
jgi:hypothetical protein